MLIEEQTVDYDFSGKTISMIKETNEQLMKNRIDSNPVASSLFKPNTTHINDKSLLLLLSLRINKQFVSQIDEQHYPLKYVYPSSISSSRQKRLCKSLSKTMNNKYENSDRDKHRLISNQRLSQSSTNSSRISETIDHDTSAFTQVPSSSRIQSDSLPTKIDPHISSNNGDSQNLSLDERISNLFGISSDTIHGISSINQSTLCDKNTKRLQQKRTLLSKYYTSAWIDSQITVSDKLPETMNDLTQKDSQLNNQCLNPLFETPEIETEDMIPISAKYLQRAEHKKQCQKEIIAIAKKAIKPAFKKHDITKEEYKKIMKKVVTKAKYSNILDPKRIEEMINAYVKKYRSVYHHNTTKT